MSAYYNENDPFAAAWLRALIQCKLIAAGDVDERSIKDVTADDVRGYTQVHCFAGIGVWSYALRNAGWPDDRPVWTGSCPCQPFSTSGKRKGFKDDRHLWPVWFPLIAECHPPVVFGEQVASPDGLKWLDTVYTEMESASYAVGAADLCAAGVGAPHIRQRLYFVADADNTRSQRRRRAQLSECTSQLTTGTSRALGDTQSPTGGLYMGNSSNTECDSWREEDAGQSRLQHASVAGTTIGMADTNRTTGNKGSAYAGRGNQGSDASPRPGSRGCILAGFWSDADWIYCRDDKFRPIEPGTFPLVTGAPARVGRLRGYGNALCAPVAETFIRAYLESCMTEAV